MHPQSGNVTKHSGKSSSNKQRAVFQEQELRSYFTGNAHHFTPEPGALAVNSHATSCGTDVLARKSGADDVDFPCPQLSVESSHIVPDRKGRQTPIALSGKQHAAAVGINFNSADGAPPKQDPTQDAASCPCKKCQLIQSFPLHDDGPPTASNRSAEKLAPAAAGRAPNSLPPSLAQKSVPPAFALRSAASTSSAQPAARNASTNAATRGMRPRRLPAGRAPLIAPPRKRAAGCAARAAAISAAVAAGPAVPAG